MGVIVKVEDVTPEQIAGWKDKLKDVKQITVVTSIGESIDFIIGRPTRDVLDAYSFQMDKEQPKKAREILQKNCILAGDADLLTDDVNLENTVMGEITKMLDTYIVTEKKL